MSDISDDNNEVQISHRQTEKADYSDIIDTDDEDVDNYHSDKDVKQFRVSVQ